MPSLPRQFSQDIKLNKNKLLDFTLDSTLGNLTSEGQFGYSSTLKIPVWNNGTSVVSFLDFTLSQFSPPTSNVSFGSMRIINISDPVSSQDAVSKHYLDRQQEEFIYNVSLKTLPYNIIISNLFDVLNLGIASSSGLTYDSSNNYYTVVNTSTYQTNNLITIAGTYFDFRFHIETSSSYVLEYKTSILGTYVVFLPDTNINILTGFTELYVKVTFTSAGIVRSHGLLYSLQNTSSIHYVNTQSLLNGTTGSVIPVGVGSLLIPANFFLLGKVVTIKMLYDMTGSNPLQFNLGSNVLISTSSLSNYANVEVTITCRVQGNNGTLFISSIETRSTSTTHNINTLTNIDLTTSYLLDVVISSGSVDVYEFILKDNK